MIKIEHLTKNYGSNCAVDDICLEIERGETVGFLGPNGAGKSTTMNILTGCLSASAGRVSINDIDMMADPIGAKKLIGYLPEQPPVYPAMLHSRKTRTMPSEGWHVRLPEAVL